MEPSESVTQGVDKRVKHSLKEVDVESPVARSLADAVADNRVTFSAGLLGESCHDSCSGIGLICEGRWLRHMSTNCDAARAAFPEASKCDRTNFGRDMPVYRPSTHSVLVNSRPGSYVASCGAKHAQTRRFCPCGFGRSPEGTSMTYHHVYNVQASPYFEWQVRYMHFWFRQVGQPGRITRLLSAGGPDHLVGEIPTHVAPPFWDFKPSLRDDRIYTPYNKATAIIHWLQHARIVEDIIVILDPEVR